MPRRAALGALDELLPPRGEGVEGVVDVVEVAAERKPRVEVREQPARKPRRKTALPVRGKLTVEIDAEVLGAAKDAVYWTPGLTLAGLVDEALRREVGRREEERGEGFPVRGGELTPGRPIG